MCSSPKMHKSYHNYEAIFGSPRFLQEENQLEEKSMAMMRIMGIERFARERAGSLPYGAQRRLEIARILAADPKLLLLDEPAAGMNPQESLELVHIIRRIREEFGLTILLIEHDMKVVMGLCESIYVMAAGQIIAKGDPREIRQNPRVIEPIWGGHGKLLEIQDLNVRYDAIRVVHNVTMKIRQGELVALIGANGAGKTTILKTVSCLSGQKPVIHI